MYEAEVNKGAALLDNVLPYWFEAVDVATLNMKSPESCLLKQLFGSFRAGLNCLQLWDCPHEYGFDFDPDELNDPKRTIFAILKRWEALEEAWKTMILDRCAEAAVKTASSVFDNNKSKEK